MKSVRIFCLALLAPLVLLSLPGMAATNLSDAGAYSGAFERCLRDAMKGVTSGRAADEVTRACREQTPGRATDETNLPPDALAKLVVHAGFGWGIFSGTLYNGNNDYAISQITVVLMPMKMSNPGMLNAQRRNQERAQKINYQDLSLNLLDTIVKKGEEKQAHLDEIKRINEGSLGEQIVGMFTIPGIATKASIAEEQQKTASETLAQVNAAMQAGTTTDDGREYNIALAVQPLTKAALSMPIPSDNTLEYSWNIVKARGFKMR
jgi:hypothetical protein